MTTTINNSQRVFFLTGDYNTKFLCNIEELEKCWNEFEDKDSIIIQQFWNNKLERAKKRNIIEMLYSLNLNSSFLK